MCRRRRPKSDRRVSKRQAASGRWLACPRCCPATWVHSWSKQPDGYAEIGHGLPVESTLWNQPTNKWAAPSKKEQTAIDENPGAAGVQCWYQQK